MNVEAAKTRLEEKLQSLSPERRALLARRLKAQGGGAQPRIQATARHGQDTFPLSFAQQRLWFLEQWAPGNPAYVQIFNLHLKGAPRPELLAEALRQLIQRHEALRTTFVTVDGQPAQRIHPQLAIDLPLTDLSQLPAEAGAAEAARMTLQEARKPFDLERGPLIRAQLLRLTAEEWRLLMTQHHIITDAGSLNLMLRELAAIYSALATGKPSPLAAPALQYVDFAQWQRNWLQGEALEKQMAYWRGKLQGLETIDLPLDHARPAMQRYLGIKRFVTLPPEIATSLRAMCQREGVTLYILTMAVFKVLLQRYTGLSSIVVGSPSANRERIETESIMGFFTNTLVMQTDMSGDPTFRELLKRVKETALEAYAHQDVPFEKLVEELHPQRDLSRSPLFQVLFQTITVPTEPLQLPGCTLAYHEFDNQTAKFDLTLQVAEMVGGLVCACEFNTELFEASTIDRLLGHYQTLLKSALSSPNERISQLPMLTAGERELLLTTWNQTQETFDAKTFPELVAEVARSMPDAVAVQCGAQSLSYRDLNREANRLARHLQGMGAGPERLVGLCVKRSPAMLIGLLGILKAGAAYVPLDPMYPKERLAHMLDDSQATILVTQESLAASLPNAGGRGTVFLDSDAGALARWSDDDVAPAAGPENLAYVIYTSGSTGRPKGAMILHRGLSNYLQWCTRAYEMAPRAGYAGVPVHSSISFDLTVTALLAPLIVGNTVHLVPEEESVQGLAEMLRGRDKFSLLKITPAHLEMLSRQLGPAEAGAARYFIVGGENLAAESLAFWRQHAPETIVVNEYGPTETVVGCCVQRLKCGDAREGVVPIGRPIANTQLYILDGALQPVPVGVAGELCIGGDGVGRGYLNQPELTARKFIRDPFSSDPNARLYRSGDLCRYRADGNIECLGRIDHQVKIRGYRIEPGEIESVLRLHGAVADCVVVAREFGAGDRRLVAYVVHKAGGAAEADLRKHLAAALPEYMVPTAFVSLEKLPLSTNGKVDRAKLPAPELGAAAGDKQRVAPRDPVEQQLVAFYEQVLNVRPVSIDDNFFDLGGHSLLAIRLFTQIQEAYGKKLPLSDLFVAPTVRQLAARVRDDEAKSQHKALVPIQPRGTRPNLFAVHGAGGQVLFYSDLARRLGEDQPFYALQGISQNQFRGNIDLVEIARGYLEEVRGVQPHGPYYLAGTSLGGVFAFEMAQQLRALGEEVAFLGFFDSMHPRYFRYLPHVTSLHRKVYGWYRVIENHWGAVCLLERGKRLAYVRAKVRRAVDEFLSTVDGFKRAVGQRISKATSRKVVDRYRVFPPYLRIAVMKYEGVPYDGKITIFRADKQPIGVIPDPTLGWKGMAAELEILDVPGYHANVVSEPRLRFLVEKLQPALAAAQEKFSGGAARESARACARPEMAATR